MEIRTLRTHHINSRGIWQPTYNFNSQKAEGRDSQSKQVYLISTFSKFNAETTSKTKVVSDQQKSQRCAELPQEGMVRLHSHI